MSLLCKYAGDDSRFGELPTSLHQNHSVAHRRERNGLNVFPNEAVMFQVVIIASHY